MSVFTAGVSFRPVRHGAFTVKYRSTCSGPEKGIYVSERRKHVEMESGPFLHFCYRDFPIVVNALPTPGNVNAFT